MSDRSRRLFETLGLSTELPIAEVCSDFYVLERLNSNAYKPAVRFFREFQAEFAKEFATYVDMVIGGEWRHADDCLPHRLIPQELRDVLDRYRLTEFQRTDAWITWTDLRRSRPDRKVLWLDQISELFDSDEWANGKATTVCGKPWAIACRVLSE